MGTIIFLLLLVAGLTIKFTNCQKPYQCPSSVTSIYPVNLIILQEHRQYSRHLYKRMKMWQLQIIPSPRTNLRRNLTSGNYNSSSLSHSQTRSFALLESVLQVAKIACPTEFVSHELFLEGALNAFHFLLDHNILGESHRYNEDPITTQLHGRIDKILNFCQENLPSEKFSFLGDYDERDCPNSLIRRVCQHSEDVPICKKLGKRGNLRNKGCPIGDFSKYSNFVLDVVWSMVDLVHGGCVIEFRKADDLTAFHAWEQAMEQLFSRRMRKYWYQPGMSMEEYQAILHPNLIQQMHNLEMCVEGHYYLRNNYRAPRLQRPSYSINIFKRK